MKYRRRKVDTNQAEITAALRAIGCSVVDLSACGGGIPDLLCGIGSRNWLLEVKRPGVAGKKRGKRQAGTNDRQATFRERWRGQVATVSSAQEAIAVVNS